LSNHHRTKLKIPNDRGEMLTATIDQPKTSPKAWVLFAHCFTCFKDIITARNIAKALLERGYAVVRLTLPASAAAKVNSQRAIFPAMSAMYSALQITYAPTTAHPPS
jgi:predicted alpha/beta-hydrolase family hydrolase